MLEKLKPEQMIFYGKVPKGCKGNIIKIDSFGKKLRERIKQKTENSS